MNRMVNPLTPPTNQSRWLVLLAVGGIGASAVMTQLALMRELLGAFSGNELVFGISLGSWLLLTAAGAWLGRWLAGAANIRVPECSHGGSGTEAAPRPTSSLARATGGNSPASRLLQPQTNSDHPPAFGDAMPPSRISARLGEEPASPGLGSPAGVAAPYPLFIAGLIAIAIIPLLQVVAVRVLRDVVFMRGSAVGLTGTALGTLAVLLPYCVVAGALLTLACTLPDLAASGRPGAGQIGRVYVADSLGSVAGGAAFSFELVPWFDHFALLCFPAAVNLLLAAALAWRFGRPVLLGSALIVGAGLAVHLCLIDADAVTTAVQHWGTPTVFQANSPYGRLVVTDSSGQLTFYENGLPVISTQNVAQVEETVHYAMCQRPDARQVLLIGGGVAGTAREILRYGAAAVTYVEIDPLIIAAGRRFLPAGLADPRITTVATDGRHFVRATAGRYDVVIVDLPDPTTLQLNRFLTVEFFAEVRRILQPGGVLSFGLGHYENFVSPELARVLSSARRTLGQVFPHVRMIPGGRVFFLAADGPLSLDIAARLEQRGLATRFVNRHYLDATLAPDRLADLDRAIAQPARLNTDFNPTLYVYFLRHWLSQFAPQSEAPAGWLLAGGVLVLVLIGLVRVRPVPRMIFAAGFAASALEVVLLVAFQVLYGSVYRQVGLVVTVFMAGLAVGAWRANRRLDRSNALTSTRSSVLGTSRSTRAGPRRLALLALAIAALAAALPLILARLDAMDAVAGGEWAGQAVILALGGGLAALVGHQFPLAAAIESGGPAAAAARLYGADLTGAALGALLVSAWLVPLFGVTTVCLLSAGLNAAAALLAWRPPTPA